MRSLAAFLLGAFAFFVLTGLAPLLRHALAPPPNPLEHSAWPPDAPLVQLAWFYKPPANGDLLTLQQSFDRFVLTAMDEGTRESLREQGVAGPFLQYVRFDAIHDPGSCTAQPWRNQVANQAGDFCWIHDEHPAWFLRDERGHPIVLDTEGRRFVLMDPANAEWRAFWLARVQRDQEALGWDGVFLDNVEGSLAKFQRMRLALADYPTDAAYQEAVLGFLDYLHLAFRAQQRPLYANLVEMRGSDVWARYLRYLDGYMEEAWAVDWTDGYLKPAEWDAHLRRVEVAQSEGKGAILVAQGGQGDTERQHFAFASYLLVTQGEAAFRYTHATLYNEAWLYSNYDLELGTPLRPRYEKNGVWHRDFTRGHVTVNPVTHEATITVY